LVQDAVLALALPVAPAPAPGLAPLLLLLELLAQPANPALAVSAAIAATLTTVIRLIRSHPKIKSLFIPNERTACPGPAARPSPDRGPNSPLAG
jgi:hypothetical protein